MASEVSGPILVYLGANAHAQLERQLLAMNPGIHFVESAVYPERPEPPSVPDGILIRFDAGLDVGPGEIGFVRDSGYNDLKVIEAVIGDKHINLLWTRFGGRMRWRNHSEVKRYEVAYSLIKAAIAACATIGPRQVVFSYEPHMLPMYLFKKVCEAMGIRTYTMCVSPFNWRVFLDTANVPPQEQQALLAGPGGGSEATASVTRFIEEKKGDYSVAKPFYEKRVQNKGPLKRLFYKLQSNGWRPHKIFFGELALRDYKAVSTPRGELQGRRYVCVFLQLQPEQTTLPDGGLFVHHLFAIQMLHAATSKMGLSIVVREHPATFETAYNLKWRPRDFYRTIKAIGDDIYFDDIEADPYALIRNAVAVSAITGTVLLEGLLQGRPAIAFGKHPLGGYVAPAFVDSFADETELASKIARAISEPPSAVTTHVEKYLHDIYPSTYGPEHYVGNTGMTLQLLREARYTALKQAIESLTMPQSTPCATI